MIDPESENQPIDAVATVESGQPDADAPEPAPTFLDDLARAMQSTAAAERTRDVEQTEQRRQVHLDGIRTREAVEADELREVAKNDVAAIDAWSDGEIRRIKLERERRIADRREQLQQRLEEHRQVIGREVDAVEAAVVSYRGEMDGFFGRLESETDPVQIARQAGTRPGFPILELIGPEDAPGAPIETVGEATDQPIDTVGEATDQPIETPADGVPATSSDDRLVGVMDEGVGGTTAAPAWPPTSVTHDAQEPEPVVAAEETVQEPAAVGAAVGAPAEAASYGSTDSPAMEGDGRGVTPRTGAGSWLRWPNSSPDRIDSDR